MAISVIESSKPYYYFNYWQALRKYFNFRGMPEILYVETWISVFRSIGLNLALVFFSNLCFSKFFVDPVYIF